MLAAQEAGLSALALTDHDSIKGCARAGEAAKGVGLDFLPGIEISCEFPRPGTLHLLGYGVDPESPQLHELTRRLIEGRETRNSKLVQLFQEEGMDVSLDELLAEAKGGTVGRPHLAAILLRKGYVSSRQEAFDKYLGQGGKFYTDKETTTPRQAIDLVHQAGGIAVLAHPTQLRQANSSQLETTLKGLVDVGLDGIEVLHSDHSDSDVEHFEVLARRYDLVPTGGSDFHGAQKPSIILGQAGSRKVPRSMYEGLIRRMDLRRTTGR